jgi:hypothetical protein
MTSITINMHLVLLIVSDIFSPDFNQMWISLPVIRKSPVPNLTEKRPVGTAFIHAERQTDMTKEIGSFRDYERAPK